jgi:hypothetical protein
MTSRSYLAKNTQRLQAIENGFGPASMDNDTVGIGDATKTQTTANSKLY